MKFKKFRAEPAEAAFLQSCKSCTSGFLPVAPETNHYVDQPLRELSGLCEKPFKLNFHRSFFMTYKIFLSFFLSIITVFAGQLVDFSKAPANGINQKASHFRYFAPGIINPAEGTLEFTVDIKIPSGGYGSKWNFLFLAISKCNGYF